MRLAQTLRFIINHPLNQGGRARAIGRFLRWQATTRLSPWPSKFPFVDGLYLAAEPHMPGASGNFYCGLHEVEDMALVLHLLRPGDEFFDIGANVGSYSLLAAAAGARVHAFEPSARTARRLQSNVALNKLAEAVQVHVCAISDYAGTIEFTVGLDTTNHIRRLADGVSAVESVPVSRFDDVCPLVAPSFLKLDVEGFEVQALAGAVQALRDPRLMGLVIENGIDTAWEGSGDLTQILAAHGFSIYRYDPKKRELRPGSVTQRTPNLLFLRDAAAAGERVRTARRFKLVNGWI